MKWIIYKAVTILVIKKALNHLKNKIKHVFTWSSLFLPLIFKPKGKTFPTRLCLIKRQELEQQENLMQAILGGKLDFPKVLSPPSALVKHFSMCLIQPFKWSVCSLSYMAA